MSTSTKPMIYTKMMPPAAKATLLRAISDLNARPQGMPEQAFLAAAGLTGPDAPALVAELLRESFLVRQNGRVMAGTAGGSRPVTFSDDAERRRELLAASPVGRAVLEEERGR